jgi:hypothetical protein
MALLVLLSCLEPFGFASHSRGDPLITNALLYHLSYIGTQRRFKQRAKRLQAVLAFAAEEVGWQLQYEVTVSNADWREVIVPLLAGATAQ